MEKQLFDIQKEVNKEFCKFH